MAQNQKTNGNESGVIFPITATNLSDAERRVIKWVNEALPKKCNVLKESGMIKDTMTPKELFYNSMCSAVLAFQHQLLPETVTAGDMIISPEASGVLNLAGKSGEFFDEVFQEINAPRNFSIFNRHNSVLTGHIRKIDNFPEEIKEEAARNFSMRYGQYKSSILAYKEIALRLRDYDFFTLLARDGDFRSVIKESLFLDIETKEMDLDLIKYVELSQRKVFESRFLLFLLYDSIEDIDTGFKRASILDAVKIIGDKLDQQRRDFEKLQDEKVERQINRGIIKTLRQDEQRVRDILERREIEARNREREQEERTRREVERRLELQEFMAQFRPYRLSNDAVALIQIIEGNSSKAEKAIRPLVGLIDQVSSKLDIRDPSLRQLGHILFSKANIATLAKAYGTGQMIGEVSGRGVNVNAGALRSLSTASVSVFSAIDNILQNPEEIILLAALLSSIERATNYVNFTLGCRKKRESIDNRMLVITSDISNLGQEMIEAFPDDVTVRALLERRTGIEKERLELDDELRKQHDTMRGEVELRIMGVSARRIAVTYAPSITTNDVKIDLPKDFQSEFALAPDDKKNFLVISREFNDKRRQAKYKTGKIAFEKLLFELRAECAQHRENIDLQKKLYDECGFTYGTNQDGQFVVRHPEYGIEVITEGDEVKLTEGLIDARKRFDEALELQRNTLRRASESGFKVEGADEDFNITGRVRLSHEEHGVVNIDSRGYLTQEDFDSIHHLLEEVQKDENGYELLIPETKAPSTKTWNPILYSTGVLLDTNIVQKATATRGEGKRWFDLLEYAASFNNVAALIVPEVVARFELQGRIPILNKDGTIKDFIQVDERYVEKGHVLQRIANTTEPFFDKASRAYVCDGKVILEQKNPKIIIWKTQGDEELYKRIREIMNSSNRIARMNEEIHHNGEGEKAIMRVIDEIPFPLGALIISDDNRFFGVEGFPKTTKHGMPLFWSGFGDYLAAETTRSKDIRRSLGGNIGGRYFSPHNVAVSIDTYWGKHKPDEYSYMSFKFSRGICTVPDIFPPRDMFELVKQGVEQKRIRDNSPSKEVETPIKNGGTLLDQKENSIPLT